MENNKILLLNLLKDKDDLKSLLGCKNYDVFSAFNLYEFKQLYNNHEDLFSLILIELDKLSYDSLIAFKPISEIFKSNIPIVIITNVIDQAVDRSILEKYQVKDLILRPYDEYYTCKRIVELINSTCNNKIEHKENNVCVNSCNTDLLMYRIDKNSEISKLFTSSEIFDYYRIVRPTDNKIFYYEKDVLKSSNMFCYSIWNRSAPCKNCISRKACITQKEYVKIDYLNGINYIIFSLPIKIEGMIYAVELIKKYDEDLVLKDKKTSDLVSITDLMDRYDSISKKEDFTQLYNKSYIVDYINSLFKEKINFSIAVIDINKFKYYNDTYGHLVGDEIILNLSSKLKQLDEKNNSVTARIGGDEFLIVSRDNDLRNISNYLKEYLENKVYTIKNQKIKIQVAIGVADSLNHSTYESIMEDADRQMYIDKHKIN